MIIGVIFSVVYAVLRAVLGLVVLRGRRGEAVEDVSRWCCGTRWRCYAGR
jgi:hypothetical protein